MERRRNAGLAPADRPGTSRASAASRVRPLVERDLPDIVPLYERIFTGRGRRASGSAQEHLQQILCRSPWRDDALPSLVCEDGAGRIVGCLGVMPRRMQIGGRSVRAAISHSFMVEPGSRASLAALALARAFLAGGQDLSIAEGGSPSRRILESLGGSTSLLYSLRWTRPLRPLRYVLSYLRRRGLPAAVSAALAPVCAAADLVAPRIVGASVRVPRSRLTGQSLTAADLLACLSGIAADRALRPRYDGEFLAWFLDLLAARKGRGRFEKVAVRGAPGDIVGWYLFYLNPGGISEVVQIGAVPGFMGEVIDHLFEHAFRGGTEAVSGQMDPAAFQALAARGCVFHHDGVSWFLVHSRDPEVLAAIHRGDAFLTRFEGEWCIGF
ncbi:MAG: GNAT family N-acetyltransferase [Acidobacteria bacterium]|nr:GNAT family N-acetyltransferase [Acidobacteriota bacterium]